MNTWSCVFSSTMRNIFICCACVFIVSFFLIPEARSSKGQCRQLEFRAAKVIKGKRLINHMIRSADVTDKQFCGALCFMEPNCVSYNLKTKSETGKHKCELNNATHEGHEEDLEDNSNYVYRGAKDPCCQNPCNGKKACQTGYARQGYRCVCPAGFTGQNCETDINECATGTHSCDVNAKCSYTKGSYKCICKQGYHGDGQKCEDVDMCAKRTHYCSDDDLCYNTQGSFLCESSTCKDIYNRNSLRENKALELKVGSQNIQVYCVMNDTSMGPCGGGGWTLVMKIDGTKQNFHYDSSLWSNRESFNLLGGETGFDTKETKLPTYWNTLFTKICLGMKIPGEDTTNFIIISQTADSLYSLIADGQYRATSLGRDMWKTLLGSQGSLQSNCNREGFNAVADRPWASKARIGILGNNEDNCLSCDSRIGFGTGNHPDNNNTCGIVAVAKPDNGENHIKAMGYILIK